MEKMQKSDYIKAAASILAILVIILVLRAVKMNISDNTKSNKNNFSSEDNIITNKDGSVSVALMGNVLIGKKIRNSYNLQGLSGFMSDEVSSVIKGSDIAIMNQTFSLSGEDEENYSISSDSLNILQDMGIGIVSLANKYFRQYGISDASNISSRLNDFNIKSSGAGSDANTAGEAAYLTYNNKTIGFLSVMKVSDNTADGIAVNSNGHVYPVKGIYGESSTDDICDAIEKAKGKCDFLIVNISWENSKNKVTKTMKSDAKSFINAGADLIAGCSDKALDVEYYKDKPILYGTGNFLINGNPASTNIYEVTISKTNKCKLKVHEYKSSAFYIS